MLGGEDEGEGGTTDITDDGSEGTLTQPQKRRLIQMIEDDVFAKSAMLKLLAAGDEHVANRACSLNSSYSTGELGFVLEFQARVRHLDSRPNPAVGGFLTFSDTAYTLVKFIAEQQGEVPETLLKSVLHVGEDLNYDASREDHQPFAVLLFLTADYDIANPGEGFPFEPARYDAYGEHGAPRLKRSRGRGLHRGLTAREMGRVEDDLCFRAGRASDAHAQRPHPCVGPIIDGLDHLQDRCDGPNGRMGDAAILPGDVDAAAIRQCTSRSEDQVQGQVVYDMPAHLPPRRVLLTLLHPPAALWRDGDGLHTPCRVQEHKSCCRQERPACHAHHTQPNARLHGSPRTLAMCALLAV